jgi:hypothetical protein
MIPGIFQQIEAAACRHGTVAAKPRTGSGTGAAELLDLITREGPITTASLMKKTGLNCHQVWGMLKHHRNSGRVKFADKAWSLSEDYKGNGVDRAVRMLRAMGYTVLAPEAKRT